MKKRYLNIVVFALFVSMLWGCSDWTKPEAEDFFEMPGNDYYENLRAYKRSEHSVAFGWFGGWTGVGASMVGSLMGLPDSVDFVSIWGNWKNLDEARMLDKKKVKEQKGTRALMCFIVANVTRARRQKKARARRDCGALPAGGCTLGRGERPAQKICARPLRWPTSTPLHCPRAGSRAGYLAHG